MYSDSLRVYFVVIPEEFAEMFLEITVFPLVVVVVGGSDVFPHLLLSSPCSLQPLPSSLTVKSALYPPV